MAYKMYVAGAVMPITPSKVKVKINNQNKTLTLMNGEEINILKDAKLTDVSFDVVLPQVPYPFTNGGAQGAGYYLSLFERLKKSKTPFQWILSRSRPDGATLCYSNLTVGMEDYQITDDAKEGLDLTVSIKLKQYRSYGTKTVKLTPSPAPSQPATATVQALPRSAESAPNNTSHTVKSGDCLWNIAKKYLGDGSRYKEIYELNKETIEKHNGGPNMIWPGDTLKLPDQ